MRFTQTFFAVAALAAVGFADDDGPCDPQNDNGVVCVNGTPVSSDGVAIATNTNTNTVIIDSSTLNPRISLVSSTDTNILVSTTRSLVVETTSLPHSLDTRTSTYLNTVVQTLDSAYTTNTLDTNTVTATSRVGGNAVTTTASTNTITTGTSSSTSNPGAMQTAGKYAPYGVAVAALGFAAAL
ncbi:unnamed protein product [Aureobasidium mustum]|uniref:Uncharacterized protein n=1 Tax=Aureobasidium mustum TaxID=2773714 RepID=A0A9N8PAR7_9PEZI|nr:unnamed protein product [Aureobasidium mustum]